MWLSPRSALGWTFDQFNWNVLRVSLHFVSGLDSVQRYSFAAALYILNRSDIRAVARLLSARMNANDDNGLVAGKWEAPWFGGQLPWNWRGSSPIFDQYLRSRGQPVGWGRASLHLVLTGIRAMLGICRSLSDGFKNSGYTGETYNQFPICPWTCGIRTL